MQIVYTFFYPKNGFSLNIRLKACGYATPILPVTYPIVTANQAYISLLIPIFACQSESPSTHHTSSLILPHPKWILSVEFASIIMAL